MQIHNLVVARYLDGRILKGVTNDFSPNRPGFHIEVDGTGEVVELRCRQLKALFFVKSFAGDPARQDVRGFVHGPAETAQGRKVAVRFRDGEFVCGYTLSWSPDREGFFLFPADVDSNNQRIYVISVATDEVKAGPQAEALANRMLADETARLGNATPGTATHAAPAYGTGAPSHASAPIARPSALGPRPSTLAPRPSGLFPAGNSTIGPRPSALRPRPRTDAA
ncbi:MAG: hypothetical protein HZA61_00640 [Candidatus Eisenbacteria bacterium]|uniref:Uncharacterized protein n=1 Tax=Eiseniibacteriota bacterium TaxID=2212470 RepID=A0A933SAA5_UNCEI|nr:hypothetical protein [Candidatus Eisenbacteria bacterium]